ncbi:serine hydrolase [Nocardioides sp.]|uniref:serine hydrolase domain-containing protein n=1 Tax=Nocardioides sp. TaxID=35761 RepID=UPI00262C2C48|nr:serine hydrolase [Nocardioides sp.]
MVENTPVTTVQPSRPRRTRRRRLRRFGIGLLIAVVLLGGGSILATRLAHLPSPVMLAKLELTAPSRQGDLFPARTLPASGTPVEFGSGSAALPDDVPWKGRRVSLDDFLSTTHSKALVVLRDGRLVQEWYAAGVTPQTRMSSWSVAKSVVSLMIGQAIGRGDLAETDRLVDLVPALRSGNRYDDITVRDLLDMTAGVDVSENYNAYWPFTGTARMFLTTDLPGFLGEHRRVTFEPGSRGDYLSVNTQLLGTILAAVEKRPLAELASDWIWSPSGAQSSATWNLDRDHGTEKSFCCLNATALDFAHIGQLVLDGGKVGDTQVVPAAWITRLATPAAHQVSDWGYSAQWWHAPGGRSNDYSAIGIYGQYIYVNPTTRTVVVKLSDHGTEQDEQETIDVLRTLAGEDPTLP